MDAHSSPLAAPSPPVRFSLHNSLLSSFNGSSVYSQSVLSTSRPEARSRLSNPLRGTRIGTNHFRITRSRSSTRSLIDASTLPVSNVRPLSLLHNGREGLRVPPPPPIATSAPSRASLPDLVLRQDARRARRASEGRSRRSNLFSREAFKDHKVRTKAALSIAFGCTLLVALALYLGLTIAGIGQGPMYHVLFILLILALTAVFCHSLLHMFMCMLHPPERPRSRRRNRRRCWAADTGDEVLPEKPIRIIMASDEDEEAQWQLAAAGDSPVAVMAVKKVVVRPPPPVYGEYRSSTRMNPSLVHWHKQEPLPPSPLTPTYDEAMNDVQRVVGYRPPSYASDVHVPATPAVPATSADMEDLHPLERERIRRLIGVAV